jgi:hypothetical protein
MPSSSPPDPRDDPVGVVPKCAVVSCGETRRLRKIRADINGKIWETYTCSAHQERLLSIPGRTLLEGEFGEPDPPSEIPPEAANAAATLLEYGRMIVSGQMRYELESATVEYVERDGKKVPRLMLTLEGR